MFFLQIITFYFYVACTGEQDLQNAIKAPNNTFTISTVIDLVVNPRHDTPNLGRAPHRQ